MDGPLVEGRLQCAGWVGRFGGWDFARSTGVTL